MQTCKHKYIPKFSGFSSSFVLILVTSCFSTTNDGMFASPLAGWISKSTALLASHLMKSGKEAKFVIAIHQSRLLHWLVAAIRYTKKQRHLKA